MKIIVGSQNPIKINAALSGFSEMFPGISYEIVGVQASSEVSKQPKSDYETLLGAQNRASSIRQQYLQADFWVGIEGGIQEDHNEILAFAWVVVLSESCSGKGRTGTFVLPDAVSDLIREGKELGEADDIVFNKTNSKQANGAVGLLTGNVIERQSLYKHAVILALIPFRNPELYCQYQDIKQGYDI